MSMLLRGIAVVCMLVACILALFQPFYTVELTSDDEEAEALVELWETEKKVSFSLFDVITDLKGELDLYNEYKDDVAKIEKKMKENPDNYDLEQEGYSLIQELRKIRLAPEDSGKFSAAMTTYVINLDVEGNPASHEYRFEAYIAHALFYIIPAVCVLLLLICTIVAVCQMIIGLLNSSAAPKATGAAIIIMALLSHLATMFLLTTRTIGYTANYIVLAPLVVLTIVGIVCDKIYCQKANITKTRK